MARLWEGRGGRGGEEAGKGWVEASGGGGQEPTRRRR